jgi:AraC-like DNA-binding protein
VDSGELTGRSRAPGVDLRLKQTPDFDAFDVWHASLSSMMFDVSLRDKRARIGFAGEVVGYNLGGALIFDSGSIGHDYLRLPTMVRRSGIDHVMIEVQTLGTRRGEFGDLSAEVREGDVSFLDFGRTLRLKETPFRHLSLILPRDRLPAALRRRNLHGVVLKRETGGAALLSRYLNALMMTADQLSPGEAAVAADAAMIVAAAVVEETTVADVVEDGEPALGQVVRRYVDDHIGNADLTPERIAVALRMSRSTLYRLLTSEGGVQSFILGRRLDRAFDVISRGRARSIAEIAFTHGFNSESHFARAFRGRFGMRPRDARDHARRGEALTLSGTSGLEQLGATLHWVRNLGTATA